MYNPFRKIRIAVIGAVSSGKSFLLYDMIHAFTILGYHPEELPLSYPHSSFGAFFYDNFNNQTGGMLKTVGICRPNNHYGAYLSGNFLPVNLPVDFLNIPGEVFMDSKDRIKLFFRMKELIKKVDGKELFYLSEWESPAKSIVKLVVPRGFTPSNYHFKIKSSKDEKGRYMSWEEILYELAECKFEEKKRRGINGEYIFEHITELNIDSLILTLESCWSELKGNSGIEWMPDDKQGYEGPEMSLVGEKVIEHFYSLAYCDIASDMVICEKLNDKYDISVIEKSLIDFFDYSKSLGRHIYLAFRATDMIIRKRPQWHQEYINTLKDGRNDVQSRNAVYSIFLNHMRQVMKNDDKDLEETLDHISSCAGDDYYNLLCYAYSNINEWGDFTKEFLPPHVYFTATPIDASFSIYENDPEDVTRFYYEDTDDNRRKSFTMEVDNDVSQHLCFGSLQLLTDILIQNGILPFWHSVLKHRSVLLKYFQYQD